MDWTEVLKAALSLFLVISGIGLGYLLFRMGGLFLSLSRSVDRVTDESVPILSRAQITMDGVNQELGRVVEIMESAVHATKGTEAAVGTFARGISAPVRWGAGLVAGVEEAVETFRSRRAAERANRRAATYAPPPPPAPSPPPPSTATAPPTETPPPVEVTSTEVTAEVPAVCEAKVGPSGGKGWDEFKVRREEAAERSAKQARNRSGQ